MKKRERAFPYYPLFLDIQGRRCLVVGGGAVALRKARALLEHGARVEVVSPEVCPELGELGAGERITITRRGYIAGDLEDALIAIAATDDVETNRRIAVDAAALGVLVNAVDDPEHSDFIVPSYLRRGDVVIAVSSGGRSPALARKVRRGLEEEFGEEYGPLALVIDEVRSKLKDEGIVVDGEAWQEALDLNRLLPLVKAGRAGEAGETLLSRLRELVQKGR